MPAKRNLTFDHDAPDLVLTNLSGQAVHLSALWADHPLLMAFTRHFGCTQCKEMLDEIVAGRDQIHAAGLEIAIILPGTLEESIAFAARFAPGLNCLIDPERRAYTAYGLERGGLFQTFLNPKVWAAISRSRQKGYRVEPPPPGQDAMQMSGTFIIGTDGKIRLPYYYDHIADHPPLDLLLSGVLSTNWNEPFDGPLGPGLAGDDYPLEKAE